MSLYTSVIQRCSQLMCILKIRYAGHTGVTLPLIGIGGKKGASKRLPVVLVSTKENDTLLYSPEPIDLHVCLSPMETFLHPFHPLPQMRERTDVTLPWRFIPICLPIHLSIFQSTCPSLVYPIVSFKPNYIRNILIITSRKRAAVRSVLIDVDI